MKSILVIIFLAATAVTASSQSISPVITSCGKKCVVDFTLKNPTLVPLFVTLEGQSFSLDKTGDPVLRPLDPGVVLVFSEKSSRVPINSEHRFTVKMTCANYPCSTMIFATMTIGKTKDANGATLQVRFRLPETLYACESHADKCRDQVRKAAGLAN
jgi:hypothetical protein